MCWALNKSRRTRCAYVALTFDDGFPLHYDVARYLFSHGIKATFFITTDLRRKFRLASTPDRIAEINDLGHEVGSHTCTHPNLLTLSQYRLRYELEESKRWLDELVGEVFSFAYPYFLYNKNVLKEVHKHYMISRARYLFTGTNEIKSFAIRFLNRKNMKIALKDFLLKKDHDCALIVLHNEKLVKIIALLSLLRVLAKKPFCQIKFVTITELANILCKRTIDSIAHA